MIKAILVDDEVHCLDTLGILLEEYCPEVEVLQKCGSGKEALLAIERLAPDVVFLDIEMPVMTGFELLEHFRTIPFAVVFTTSYDQYAIRAIRFSALDYLLKPVNARELVAAVQKVQTQKSRPSLEQFEVLLQQVHPRTGAFNKMAVPTSEGYELIALDQVLRCEAHDNYTHIVLKGKPPVIACRTLKDIEEQLQDHPSFVRVHHSYLVNLNEVVKYVRGEGGYLVMSEGPTVNVSRTRKEALLKWF